MIFTVALPVVKTQCFHCQGLGSIPGSGGRSLNFTNDAEKKIKKKYICIYVMGFQSGPSGKVPVCQCRDVRDVSLTSGLEDP